MMKRVINGKRYDTETATQIASADANCPQNDFRYWDETLYRKQTGEFFLYGEGGPMTQWARALSNGRIGGSDIRPLTDAMAREWVEHNANARYEDIFGPAPE